VNVSRSPGFMASVSRIALGIVVWPLLVSVASPVIVPSLSLRSKEWVPSASGPAVDRGGSRGTIKSRAKAAAALSADDHLRFRQAGNLRDSNGSCEDQLDRRRERKTAIRSAGFK